MLGPVAQTVRQRRCGVQGQWLLPHGQPRLEEELEQRLDHVEFVIDLRGIQLERQVQLVLVGEVEFLEREEVRLDIVDEVGRYHLQLASWLVIHKRLTDGRTHPLGLPTVAGMRDSRNSLNPSLPTRLSQWLRPDWSRTVLARRIAAAGLVVLAGVAALRSDPDGDRVQVVVAAHDLSPGAALTADDLRLEKRLVPTIPDGSQSGIDAVVGSTLAGPARRGEVLTDVRLLGRRLAEAAAGPDARIVPVHPADSALADLVRPGDVVDVVAAFENGPQSTPKGPSVIATNAVVVLVSAKQKAQAATSDRVVLVALPAASANAVAGAALVQTVTLTLH